MSITGSRFCASDSRGETILGDKRPVELVFHGLASLFPFWHLLWFVFSKYYNYCTKELPNVAAFHKAE